MNTIQFGLSHSAPEARALAVRWSLDEPGITIPTGRMAFMLYEGAVATGLVRRAEDLVGLRGTRATASVAK